MYKEFKDKIVLITGDDMVIGGELIV